MADYNSWVSLLETTNNLNRNNQWILYGLPPVFDNMYEYMRSQQLLRRIREAIGDENQQYNELLRRMREAIGDSHEGLYEDPRFEQQREEDDEITGHVESFIEEYNIPNKDIPKLTRILDKPHSKRSDAEKKLLREIIYKAKQQTPAPKIKL